MKIKGLLLLTIFAILGTVAYSMLEFIKAMDEDVDFDGDIFS